MTPEVIKVVPAELLEALAALYDEGDVREEQREGRSLDWTPPPDLDRSKVEQRARLYLAKVPGAVSGESGHDQTYHAACILVVRYGMTPEQAYPLLEEWNATCSPPWDANDLWRKLREVDEKETGPRGEYLRPIIRERRRAARASQSADNAPPAPGTPDAGGNGDGRPTRFWNYRVYEDNSDSRTVVTRVGLSLSYLADQLNAFTGGWPKRVGQLLFAVRDHEPIWIRSASSLFAWIGTELQTGSANNDNGLQWAEGADKVKHSQFYDYLLQTAEEFETVELYPHEPPLAGHCYVHEPLAGGDGTAFNELLSRFLPASDVDAMLIRAFFLSLLWGGLPGQRPAWLFTGEEGDSGTGRGVGKSTIAQLGGRLVGGYVSLSSNESFGDVQRRLLSPVALEKRVVLLDNIKSLRFSWGELEGLITDTTISGRQMHTGEGQRPNTLLWVLTFNGASLSKDLAQRCIVVKLRRPHYVGRWMADAINFIEENRAAILGDIVEELRRKPVEITPRSRWGCWEQEILAHVDDPQTCQDVIAERAMEADDDREEMEAIRDAFKKMIQDVEHCDPDETWVNIPSEMAANIVNGVTGERKPTGSIMKLLYLLGIPEIKKNKSRNYGRGCTWRGTKTNWPHARQLGKLKTHSQENEDDSTTKDADDDRLWK